MRLVSIVAAVLIAVVSTAAVSATSNARFVGRVVTEWLSDGREMRLLEPFEFIAPDGSRWQAPQGSVVDGASIPRFAWAIIGGPFEGKYREASVIHDVACVEKKRSWQAVHRAFYDAMLTNGVGSKKAYIMYGAVFHFGPRWERIVKVTEVPYSTYDEKLEQLASHAIKGEHASVTVDYKLPNCERCAVGPPETVDLLAVYKPDATHLSEEEFALLAQQIESGSISSLEQIESFDPN